MAGERFRLAAVAVVAASVLGLVGIHRATMVSLADGGRKTASAAPCPRHTETPLSRSDASWRRLLAASAASANLGC